MASPEVDSPKPDIDEDTPMKSDDDTSNSGSSSSGEEDEQTEWLVTTRKKRSTAGNRLSTLIQQAAAEDDELELLFAEDEDDVGFEDAEGDASDVQMDSSDDDDDQGPVDGVEELEGERELQQQARAERQAKKRKANDGIPKAFRKKVKIDPTAPNATPPRPKKKSERASWIPTPEDAPTRASARRTTKISKEQLHAQMLEREKRRLRQLAIMEKAEKKKNAEKPKEITQDDRLAEAARVEMSNAHSLNSWEEAEKAREEERRAKLEALHNRKMQGPFITWWSGLAEWVGGKLKHVGKNITIEEKPKSTAGRKRKVDEMLEEGSVLAVIKPSKDTTTRTDEPQSVSQELSLPVRSIDAIHLQTQAPDLETQPSSSDCFESRPGEGVSASDQPSVAPNVLQSQAGSVTEPPLISTAIVPDEPDPILNFCHPISTNGTSSSLSNQTLPARMVPSQTTPFTFALAQSPPPPPPPPPPQLQPELPPVVEKGTYNCLILENFDETAMKSKDSQCQVLFHRKFPKTHKPPPPTPCAITAYPAKFRDPATNLPYCNAYAYKEIQKLKRGEYKWSTLLQAYVGQSQYAARGVPARFIKPANATGEPRSHPIQGLRR